MPGFYISKYRVPASFAAGWPALIESHGFSVDAEPTTLGGRLIEPVQTGIVYWRTGGIWLTVGAPLEVERQAEFTHESYSALCKTSSKYFIVLLECGMPTFWSTLVRRGLDEDSKACFDKITEILHSYGFVELNTHQVIDVDGHVVELTKCKRKCEARPGHG